MQKIAKNPKFFRVTKFLGLGWVGLGSLGWGGLELFENFKVYQSWVGNWVERFLNKIKDD